jgi:hypothetical protein
MAALSSGVGINEARRNPEAFVRYVMQDETGKSVGLDTFTRFYVRTFELLRAQGRHASIITPPGLGKSSLARVLFTRAIGQQPSLRTVVTAADVGVATNSVTLCREIVTSQQYMDVFPNVKPDYERSKDARGWRMSQWFLRTPGQRSDPTMQAVAETPKGEAIRVDMLLADDMVTEATCEGAVHEKIVNAFFKTWIEGRLSNGGWCVYQQNVRRKGDLAHRLVQHPKFTSVWIGLTDDCERLFVKVWNPPPGWDHYLKTSDLTGFRVEEVGAGEGDYPPARMYSMPLPDRKGWTPERLRLIDTRSRLQLYHLNAGDPAGLMMPHFLTRRGEPKTVTQMMQLEGQEVGGLPVMTDRDRLRYVLAMGVDLGPESRDGAMSINIGAKDVNGVRYPVEVDSGRWTLGALVNRIDQSWRRGIRPSIILVENNGLQTVIVRAIQDMSANGYDFEWAHLVVGHHTGTQKWSTQIGLPALDVLFEQGVYKWSNVESTRSEFAHHQRWLALEMHLSQLTKQSARAATPDDVMAFWFMDTGLQRFSAAVAGRQNASLLTGSSLGGHTSADLTIERF